MLQVPTDSISKFLAIFGLAICISSAGFFYKELEKYRDMEGQLERLNTQISFRDRMAELAVSRFQDSKNDLSQKLSQSQGIKASDVDSLKRVVSNLQREAKAYLDLVGEAVPKIRELKLLQRYSAYYFFASGVLFVIGIVISLFGFRSWNRMNRDTGLGADAVDNQQTRTIE